MAECGICSNETPPELVVRLAWQKARDVALGVDEGVVLGCDTVAECLGTVLGKPLDEDHARQMLRMLRGRVHHVYSGICLWKRPGDQFLLGIDCTRLRMEPISDDELEVYLATGLWQDKAGAFGYQDGVDWIIIEEGSESNVVGLPMEKLGEMLRALPV
jgi:septum formation protein